MSKHNNQHTNGVAQLSYRQQGIGRILLRVGHIPAVACSFACILCSSNSQAQTVTPGFSHGPTIQAFRVGRVRNADGTLSDWQTDILASGAGYSFNFNLYRGNDATKIAWFTVAVPVYGTYTSENRHFNMSPALSLGTYNNLISIGAGYGLFDTMSDRKSYGLFLGRADASMFFWSINLGFNFGSGTTSPPAGPPVGNGGAPPSADSSSPPNFVKLW